MNIIQFAHNVAVKADDFAHRIVLSAEKEVKKIEEEVKGALGLGSGSDAAKTGETDTSTPAGTGAEGTTGANGDAGTGTAPAPEGSSTAPEGTETAPAPEGTGAPAAEDTDTTQP